MNHSNFLREIRALLVFLQSLWGILSGISLFFPLSNDLLQIIPLAKLTDEYWGEGAALMFLSPKLITTITTVTIFFVLLKNINKRQEIKSISRLEIRQSSTKLFGFALVTLVIYLLFIYFVSPWIDSQKFIGIYHIKRLAKILNDLCILGLYSVFFV